MRMAASWSRAFTAPPNTRLWREESAPVAWLRSDRLVTSFIPPMAGWTGNAPRQGSRLRAPASRLTALTRPRSQSVYRCRASAHCADARPREEERNLSGDVALDNKRPIQGTSRARRCVRLVAVTPRRARGPPIDYANGLPSRQASRKTISSDKTLDPGTRAIGLACAGQASPSARTQPAAPRTGHGRAAISKARPPGSRRTNIMLDEAREH